MYKGEIEGFPTEVVEKMLERQEKEGGNRNISVFEECKTSGFIWSQTIEGHSFWSEVILNKKFDLFFQRYPKQELPKRGDRILVSDDNGEWDERIFLCFIEGACLPVRTVAYHFEAEFIEGKPFGTSGCRHWKLIEKKSIFPFELKLEDASKILNVACGMWKDRLVNKWGVRLLTDRHVLVDGDFYNEMISASNEIQKEVLQSIFK